MLTIESQRVWCKIPIYEEQITNNMRSFFFSSSYYIWITYSPSIQLAIVFLVTDWIRFLRVQQIHNDPYVWYVVDKLNAAISDRVECEHERGWTIFHPTVDIQRSNCMENECVPACIGVTENISFQLNYACQLYFQSNAVGSVSNLIFDVDNNNSFLSLFWWRTPCAS